MDLYTLIGCVIILTAALYYWAEGNEHKEDALAKAREKDELNKDE